MVNITIKSVLQDSGEDFHSKLPYLEKFEAKPSMRVFEGRMKPFNKRLNKRKASKVTYKTHRKHNHPPLHDEVKEITDGVTAVRPEDIKIHQHY